MYLAVLAPIWLLLCTNPGKNGPYIDCQMYAQAKDYNECAKRRGPLNETTAHAFVNKTFVCGRGGGFGVGWQVFEKDPMDLD
jgi:hypothetical protein